MRRSPALHWRPGQERDAAGGGETRALEWSARWYLWDGGFLAVGRSSGAIPPHSHHAVQICFSVDLPIRIRGAAGEWQECQGAIVRPNAEHSFDGHGMTGAMLFVEPESAEGRWLQASLSGDITIIPPARLEACAAGLRQFLERPLEAPSPEELIRACVAALCAGAPPLRRLDPRVAGALASIRAADDRKISLEDAAAGVFLSPGRFAHLFAEHVGLPFRRYVLWRKLTRALLDIGRGRTMSEAAHAAGFADAAHLTRTCNQMFGIPPSVLLKGEFFEIAPPFQVAA